MILYTLLLLFTIKACIIEKKQYKLNRMTLSQFT